MHKVNENIMSDRLNNQPIKRKYANMEVNSENVKQKALTHDLQQNRFEQSKNLCDKL